jgi:hypothetical protein
MMDLDFNADQFNEGDEDLLPNPDWGVDRLADYAKSRFKIAGFFGRKTAVQLYRAGVAVNYAKTTLKQDRKWTLWAQRHEIPLGAAWEVSKIADTFRSEDDLNGLTAFEAKIIAGVLKEKPKKSKVEKPKGDGKTKVVTNPSPTVTTVVPKDAVPIANGTTILAIGHQPGQPPQEPPAVTQDQDEDLEAEIVKACHLLRTIIKAAGDKGTRVKPTTTMTVNETVEDLRRVLEWAA